MQFVIRFDVEDAVVRVLTDHAMQLLPFALPLKLLRIGLFAGLDFIGLGGGHIVGQVYVHSYEIKHGFPPEIASLLPTARWQETNRSTGFALNACTQMLFVATIEGELLFIDMKTQARSFRQVKVEVAIVRTRGDDVVFQQERSEQLRTPRKLRKRAKPVRRCN